MSTASTIGVPKLLPVTATFALPFALMHAVLGVNCIKARLATSTSLGKDSSTSLAKDNATKQPVTIDGETGDPMVSDPLLVATSIHGNFTENVPLAMIIAGAIEMNGGNRKVLAGVLAWLTFSRIAHAVGLNGGKKAIRGRQVGYFGTILPLLGMGGWATWLVRGYWGF